MEVDADMVEEKLEEEEEEAEEEEKEEEAEEQNLTTLTWQVGKKRSKSIWSIGISTYANAKPEDTMPLLVHENRQGRFYMIRRWAESYRPSRRVVVQW